jgi:hypothetical protein
MKPASPNTDYAWKAGIDYRREPERYRVGKGEQGVLICEPYKSELLPHWRFRTPDVATQSSTELYDMFLDYLARDDFPGADMARKYLQMGFTRARRYTNYKGGRKYAPADGHLLERGTGDPQKTESAEIFYRAWRKAEADPRYATRKTDWKARYG